MKGFWTGRLNPAPSASSPKRHKHTYGKQHCGKVEAEVRGMVDKARSSRTAGSVELGEGVQHLLFQNFQQELTLRTSGIWTSSQNCERIHVCCLKPPGLGHFFLPEP